MSKENTHTQRERDQVRSWRWMWRIVALTWRKHLPGQQQGESQPIQRTQETNTQNLIRTTHNDLSIYLSIYLSISLSLFNTLVNIFSYEQTFSHNFFTTACNRFKAFLYSDNVSSKRKLESEKGRARERERERGRERKAKRKRKRDRWSQRMLFSLCREGRVL